VLVIVPAMAACQAPVEEIESTSEVEEPVAAEPEPAEPAGDTPAGDTIVDVAVANGSFETLVAAVQAADLVDVLSGEGPFTVFAPTDDAFAALPDGVLDALLLPENQEALA